MKILKGIASIVLYIMLGGIYIVSLFTENKKIFYGVTILILFNLIHSIIRNWRKLRKNKDKKVLRIGIITINCISLILSAMWIYTFNNIDEFYKIINEEYYASFENDKYNSEFVESKHGIYKIIHRENIESALPMINKILDEIELKSKNIFGSVKEPVTIKFDYDNDIFKSRLDNGNQLADGYYAPGSNTVYMYAEDALEILFKDSFYRGTLSHEIAHHYYYKYIKDNNISDEKIPLWFSEGVAEYMSSDEVCNNNYNFKFTQFTNIDEYDEWNSIESGMQYVQSLYTINKLVDIKGKEIIKNILVNTKEDGFSNSFEKAVGISLNDFEKEIKKDIESSKGDCNTVHENGFEEYFDIKIEGFENYIKKYPNDIEAYTILSNFYSNYGRKEEAIKLLEEGIRLNPNNEQLKHLLKLQLE
ncbi:MAG: hypothetical protein RSF37_00790 [Clostridium sp.]|uniref:tetratricopeptide repeat protein n=1 Tax=Clostridium sp. TaxID=1506 RepID=UPI002FC8DF21